MKTSSTRRKKLLKRDLKVRGWTDALIKQFYPVPDEMRRNPRYPSAPPMKLYDPKRVSRIESTKKFRDARTVAGMRREAASLTADRRRTATAEWVERLPTPTVPSYSRKKLTALAVASYNSIWSGDPDKRANEHDDRAFLDRICVNFLRHECSDYEKLLFATRGKVGASDARLEIRRMVLDAISWEYLWLAAECLRQEKAADDLESYKQAECLRC